MLFCDCVQDYFRVYLVQQRGYGSNTLASYRDTFKLLMAYMQERGSCAVTAEMASIDAELITGYLSWLEEFRGNSASTRNVRLAHLKSFASYTASASPEDSGTCAKICAIPTKSLGSTPPDSLSRAEVEILLRQPGTETRAGLRDSAMLSLLYDSACRAQELADMDVCDISWKRPCSVSVVGKGRKSRRIPLLAETGDLVGAYIEAFKLSRKSPLFLNRSGNRLTRAGVSNVVERHWRAASLACPGIAEHDSVKPHLLRHSKATHLVEEGVNIYYVRDFLGHSSVTTTQVYLKTNLGKMREAIESASIDITAQSDAYYTASKKNELMAFLETLV